MFFNFAPLWFYNLSNLVIVFLIAIYFLKIISFFYQVLSLFFLFFLFCIFLLIFLSQFHHLKLNWLKMNMSPGFNGLQVLEIRLGLGCNDLVFSSKKRWNFFLKFCSRYFSQWHFVIQSLGSLPYRGIYRNSFHKSTFP
jgi:hypothetical protein